MPARFALLLLVPLPAAAAPGPAPHEYRLDRHGHSLPPGAVARLGVPPPLSGFARAVGWSADGTRFAVVDSADVTVFDAATGRRLESQAVTTEGRGLYSPLSGDGRFVFLLAGKAGMLYDLTSAGTRTVTFPEAFADPQRKAYSLTLSADGRVLAGVSGTSAGPGVAWRFDLARDRFARMIHDRADLHTVRLSPDGRRAYATAGPHDPDLTARDAATGKEFWTVRRTQVGSVRAVSADGRRLTVADADGVTVHDAADGKVVLRAAVDSSTPQGMWGIDLSPDGTRLALAVDREVAVWDVSAGKVRHRLPHRAARLVAFAPDGKSLLSVSAWVQRWDVATGNPAYPTPVLDRPTAPSHLRWSADGRRLLTVWPGDRRGDEREWKPDLLAVWDVRTMDLVWRQGVMSVVDEAHLDRTGTTVRAVSRDDKLRVWTLGPPATATAVDLKPPPILASERVTEFFPDGRLVVQHHGNGTVAAEVYDPAGGHTARKTVPSPWKPDWRGRGPVMPVRTQTGVMLAPDGQRTDLTIGRPLPPLELRAGYRPIGQPLVAGTALIASRAQASGPDSGVPSEGMFWDATTGGYAFNLWFRMPDWAAAALSADGRWVANADKDGIVFLDVPDLRRFLAAPPGLADHDVLRKRLQTRERDRPRYPIADTKLVAFSPDAQFLASAHADGTVLVWPTPPAGREPWNPADADRLWASLFTVDAGTAWTALWHLLDHPAEATEFLGARLKAVPLLTDTYDQIARLDHPRYAVREAATRELAGRGALVEGDLRAVWEKTRSAEQRERLEGLLNRLDPTVPPTGEVLRGLRAIWVLERLGTPEAKRLLETMAAGATGSRVTLEAKAALGRVAPAR